MSGLNNETNRESCKHRFDTFPGALLLMICAFVTGAAIMIYEFLAVRFLQRYYGSSLDVWASEIAVCLGGIAVGYAAGGWLADRFRSKRVLGGTILFSGLFGFPLERVAVWTGERLLAIDTGLSWHPLIAAGVSSFLPFLALGAVVPQAIRLHVRDLDHVGTAAGRMGTLSTLGSIAGALLTARVLVPYWGVRESLYGTAAILTAFGAAMVIPARRGSRRGRTAAAVVLFLLAGGSSSAQVVFENYSAYHHILVEDDGAKRSLRFDNAVQSTMTLSDPSSGGFEYTDFFHVPFLLDPSIGRALFVGLGGGTGPKAFLRYYPTVAIDVAEIDPMVERVAREFFAVPQDPRLRIAISDGRTFLQRSGQRYGALIVDAYGSGPQGAFIPYHLATLEFFRLAWGRLDNGGCLVYNVMGIYGGDNDDIVRNVMTTLSNVFQAVYAFRARTSVNTVFVAMRIAPAELAPDGTKNGAAWPAGPWLQHPLSDAQFRDLGAAFRTSFAVTFPKLDTRVAQFSPVQTRPTEGSILTDNYAPVDVAAGLR